MTDRRARRRPAAYAEPTRAVGPGAAPVEVAELSEVVESPSRGDWRTVDVHCPRKQFHWTGELLAYRGRLFWYAQAPVRLPDGGTVLCEHAWTVDPSAAGETWLPAACTCRTWWVPLSAVLAAHRGRKDRLRIDSRWRSIHQTA